MAAFKKNFSDTLKAHTADIPTGKVIEIWFQDEARIGQKKPDHAELGKEGKRGHASLPISVIRTPTCSVPSAPKWARGRH